MKKTLFYMFSICCILLLSACNMSNEGIIESNSGWDYSSKIDDLSESDGAADEVLGQDLEMITGELTKASSQAGAASGISSENGYYEVVNIFSNGMNILYTDYETNRQMFLCARPECTHDNETCQSFVDTTARNLPGLAFKKDKLFIISPASVDGEFKPRIEMADADGTNRHIVAEYEPNQNIGAGLFCADDQNLYFIMEDYQMDGSYAVYLEAVNYETGKKNTLVECEPTERLYDGKGKYLYLHNLKYPEVSVKYPAQEDYETPEEFEDAYDKAFQEELKSLRQQVLQININEPTEKNVVDEWQNGIKEGGMKNGVFYSYNYEKNTFECVDYETGIKKSVENVLSYDMEDITFATVVDGIPVLHALIGHISEGDYEDLIIGTFAIDFENSKVLENKLMNDWNRPVEICGLYKNNVFVINRIEEVEYTDEVNGEITQMKSYFQKQAYLTLDDYLSGRSNYFPTEMVNLGR